MKVKISKRTVDDLLTMIEHTRRDMSYGEGGTFNTDAGGMDNKFDKKDSKKVLRAIAYIKEFLIAPSTEITV